MHGCIKIYLLSHTPTLIHLQTCWMVLQVDPGLTCSSVSGSCPGAGSHCTGAADSQAQHVNHWRKHRSTSALSLRRRFSRMLGAPNPGLDLGWSQYERFPLAPRGDVAGSSPKASIPSHRAPQASAGASSPGETGSTAAVTMALQRDLQQTHSARQQTLPWARAPLAASTARRAGDHCWAQPPQPAAARPGRALAWAHPPAAVRVRDLG